MAMMKHMAAAVLYAVVGLLSPVDLDTLARGAEGDGDLECVAFETEPERRGDSLVLTAASRLCGASIDGAWVVRHHHHPAAAAAIHQTRDHVALVDLAASMTGAVAAPGDAAKVSTTLLAAALDRCRTNGALKVVVRAQGLHEADVRRLAEPRGYRFSRSRSDADNAEIVEFYTDLYWSQDRAIT